MKSYLLIFLTIISFNLFSQIDTSNTSNSVVDKKDNKTYEYDKVKVKPEFSGGLNEFLLFIANTTKYPPEAKKKRIEGRVWVSFIINKEGEVIDIKLHKKANNLLNKEALRVANLIPDWKPGKINNKAVKVMYILPINFKLGNKSVSKTKI